MNTIQQLQIELAAALAALEPLDAELAAKDELLEAAIAECERTAREKHLEENALLIDAVDAAASRAAAAQTALKQAIKLAYEADPSKKTIAPGCSVRVTPEAIITDEKAAVEWAFDQFSNGNGKYISFDQKAFAKNGTALIEAGVAPFAKIEDKITPVISPKAFDLPVSNENLKMAA